MEKINIKVLPEKKGIYQFGYLDNNSHNLIEVLTLCC